MSPLRFVHIGYPKNLSTSLQRSFFSVHPDIYYLGIGCDQDNTKYIDDRVSAYVEMYIRYSKSFLFHKELSQMKETFNYHFSESQVKNKKAVGLSSEILTITFSPWDNDLGAKAERINALFGSNTKIIILIRNQFDLLRSFYKECVRIGYPHSFQKFIEFQYKYQLSTFSTDFLFDQVYKIYSTLFGKKNVLLMTYESIISESIRSKTNLSNLTNRISEHLQINCLDLELEHHNVGLSDSEVILKRNLNVVYPHDISNITYDFIESHRLNPYFREILATEPFKKDFKDVRTKRKSLEEARINSSNSALSRIDFSIPKEIEIGFNKMYSESNRNLMNMTGLDIESIGYPI